MESAIAAEKLLAVRREAVYKAHICGVEGRADLVLALILFGSFRELFRAVLVNFLVLFILVSDVFFNFSCFRFILRF